MQLTTREIEFFDMMGVKPDNIVRKLDEGFQHAVYVERMPNGTEQVLKVAIHQIREGLWTTTKKVITGFDHQTTVDRHDRFCEYFDGIAVPAAFENVGELFLARQPYRNLQPLTRADLRAHAHLRTQLSYICNVNGDLILAHGEFADLTGVSLRPQNVSIDKDTSNLTMVDYGLLSCKWHCLQLMGQTLVLASYGRNFIGGHKINKQELAESIGIR